MFLDMYEPLVESQTTMQLKLTNEVDRTLFDHAERLNKLEFAMYSAEKPDSRFDKIYKQLNRIQAEHKKDQTKIVDLKSNIEAQLSQELFKLNSGFQSLDIYKSGYESLKEQAEHFWSEMHQFKET